MVCDIVVVSEGGREGYRSIGGGLYAKIWKEGRLMSVRTCSY